MTQKLSGIGPPGTQAGAVCDRARHRYPIISIGMYIPHGESQKIISVGMYIPHGEFQKIIFVRMYITHSQSKENVPVRMYIPHGFMYTLVCERCNYHTCSALVNCLLSWTTSHTIWCRKLCGIGLSITSTFTARTVCKVPWPSILFLFLHVIYYSTWKFWNTKRAIQILSTMVQQRIHK